MIIRRKKLRDGTPVHRHEVVEWMRHLPREDEEEVPPYEWDDVMAVVSRKGSANGNGCYIESQLSGRRYWLWEISMEDILRRAPLSGNGNIGGRWGFRKFGNHVGVKWISPLASD